MRRADRLFSIVQILRRRALCTAGQLATELGVSERTVYRDIKDLIENGVPIDGAAGVGYRMGKGFDMPPLMFSLEEVEALMFGMRMVEQWADRDLGRSAKSVLEKVETVLPAGERRRLASTALFALSFRISEEVRRCQRTLRRAINERRKVAFDYEDRKGARTRRIVRPLGLFFWGETWTLGAYCETREDFRNFRLDRMTGPRVMKDQFELAPPVTLADYLAASRSTG